MKNASQPEFGYTLIELIVTITIIAVIAAVAVPAFSSVPDKKLQLAAAEYAAAMRFARSESIRTGEPHGFYQQTLQNKIRVFRLDTATQPATLVYDVYHPVEKSLYDFDLDLQSHAAADSVTRSATYRGTCSQKNRVYFDANGTPWCSEPTSILLESFRLTFTSAGKELVVTLDAVTGRVTVR